MKCAVAVLLAMTSLAFANFAQAAPVRIYELNGSLNDAQGGPAITANGGVLDANGYRFDRNQGLTVSGLNLVSDGAYTIELGFSFDNISGYRKIVDFSGLASDVGLYSLGSSLNFYPVVNGPSGVISAATLINLVISRTSTGTVTGTVNGVQQWVFQDTNNRALSNTLNFFIDDRATGGRESTSGFVDYVRISDGNAVSAVPLPAALPLFIAGLAGFGVMTRRRRMAKATA
jgi:hypothetical protein